MARSGTEIRTEFEQLLDVGIALSSQHDLDVLLGMILSEARRFTKADAGTVYLVKGQMLSAKVGQCQTFIERWGAERARQVFQKFSIPIGVNSIAGAAASSKTIINIPDVQEASQTMGFQYDDTYDKANDYSTHSNLAVPMMDVRGAVIGVLQLINAKNREGEIVPFNENRVKLARALASQAGVSIQNAMLTYDLKQAHLETLERLGLAAEWRDKETANHITRVSQYCRIMAVTLGWKTNGVELLGLASPMHDVGKLGIPDGILHKPGRLTLEEREVMEKHTIIGANIMAHAKNDVMRLSYEIALGHHEKWNGEGYPRKLKGEQIPLSCRIVALADVFDALSCRRVYKEAFPDEKVLAIIDEDTGTHFDPEVVKAFKISLDEIIAVREKYADSENDFAKFRDYQHIQLEA